MPPPPPGSAERRLLNLAGRVDAPDGGGIVIAALQWQGERIRLDASLRACASPTVALLRQLPDRGRGVQAATKSF